MAVFMRRGGNGKKKPVSTVWKKYSIAYTGTTKTITLMSSSDSSHISNVAYYDSFDYPKDGNPQPTGSNTVDVSYDRNGTAPSADVLKKKLIQNSSQYYYCTSKSAVSEYSESQHNVGGSPVTIRTYSVKKEAIGPITEATARDMAIPGDYIELVESENSEMYPENGPYGIYWYIKQ